MTAMKENLKKLSQIFSDTVKFIVPDYQRGYSWGQHQLDDLWEDLENITDTRTHYTGMFTFSKSESIEDALDVVDGQQRMTTLIILINELLNRIEGGIEGGMAVEEYKKKYLYSQRYGALRLDYRFQYSVDNPSDVFFKTKILCKEDSDALHQPENTLYTKNLKTAKNYFAEKIQNFDQTALKNLFKKVTENLLFNEYLIENLDDVYVTFETMNNRGKQLSTLELLKNRLIYLTTLIAHKNPDNQVNQQNVRDLRQNINNAWKTIYEYLGKSTKRVLNDDIFLRDHWIMYFRYDRTKSEVFKKDLLSSTFTAKRVLKNELSVEELNKYVINLQKSIVVWYNINCPDECILVDSSKKWLTRLNRVGLGSFKPLLMAAYLKKQEIEVLPLVEACEKFRFLIMHVSERRSNTADTYFYSLAHTYFVSTADKDLAADVNLQTKHWLKIDSFISNSIERYQKYNGFCSWKGLRYFLYEYEEHLQGHEEVKAHWDIFEQNQTNRITIEHIYPQTPTAEYWTTRFATVENKNLINSLGNLLLLSRSKNSSLQNDPFTKKKITRRDLQGNITYYGYDTGSHSEITVSQKNDWTPEEIITRGKEMLSFLKTHWHLEHAFTDDEIEKLLNISNNVETIGTPDDESNFDIDETENEENT